MPRQLIQKKTLSKTPDVSKKSRRFGNTPKSAPQVKRKKLVQELDEEISDAEFEDNLFEMKALQKKKHTEKIKKKIPQMAELQDEEEDDDEEEAEEEEENGADDDDDDDEEDNDDDDDDDDDDSDEETKGQHKTLLPIKDLDKTIKNLDAKSLLVRNIPYNTSDEALKELSGDINRVRLARRKGVTTNVAFAVLRFDSNEIAEKNQKLLHGMKVGDRNIYVSRPGAKVQTASVAETDNTKLFVTRLPKTFTEENVKEIFPESTTAELPKNRKGQNCLGYAFVTFSTAQECKKAHDSTQNYNFHGRHIVVKYCKKRENTKKSRKTKKRRSNNKPEKGTPKAKKPKLETSEEKMEMSDDEDDNRQMKRKVPAKKKKS